MQKSEKTVSILKDIKYIKDIKYKECNMCLKCLRNSTFKRMNLVWHVLKFIPQ